MYRFTKQRHPDGSVPIPCRLFASLHLIAFFMIVSTIFMSPISILAGQFYAYIPNSESHNVSVIDTATNTVVATIPVGDRPIGITVNPSGTKAYVANVNGGSISVIDTSSNTVVATIPVASPLGIDVTPDGKRIYVSNWVSSTVSVIDASTNGLIKTISVGGIPEGLAITPDGTRVYVSNGTGYYTSVIDTSTDTVISQIPVGNYACSIAINPQGTRVYVGNAESNTVSVIDASTNTIVATVPVDNWPNGIAVDLTGRVVYVVYGYSNNISIIDVSTNTVIGTITTGAPSLGIGLTPDGTTLYVGHYANNSVSAIDVASKTVIATIPVGIDPRPFGKFITNSSGPVESILTPSIPDGPTSGNTNVSYTFSTGGSVSDLGHSVEYQFDWKGDGTDLSPWESPAQSKTWSSAGTYNVKARARCATHNDFVSSLSSALPVAITQATIPQSVTTNPSGLLVVVDGNSYRAPQSFNWEPGSPHTLSVSSPQDDGTGTRNVFASWSDGGAQTHTINSPPASTTYTANFTRQYRLITSAAPTEGGTISPSGTNWYNAGDSIGMSASANSGYTFSGWSGDLSGSANPTLIIMSGPKNVAANFSQIAETVSTPVVPSGPLSGNTGISYGYSTGGSTSNLGHAVEYQFDWKGNGSDLSPWGSAAQSKTWAAAETYNVRARARCGSHNSVVSPWSSSIAVIMTQQTISCTINTNPSGLQIVVDGTNYTAPKSFNWVPGSGHAISVISPQGEGTGLRRVFSSWNDEGTQTHTVTVPTSSTTYTANFTTQYSLTASVNPPGAGTVNPSGLNWYDSGQSVSVSATPFPGYGFSNWAGDLLGSSNPASLIVNGSKNVVANFTQVSETITSPVIPSGPLYGNTDALYSYSTGGASSNLGHTVEYEFDWKGDGADPSPWGSAIQSKAWKAAGTYNVRARARCASHNGVASSWSDSLAVTITQAPVSCTVTTNPSGLQVVVDRITYLAPQTFQWTPGSPHAISTGSPQGKGNGTQHVFSRWSDGGAQDHTISVPASGETYTAHFTTEYCLKTAVNPAGAGKTSPSGENWYVNGKSISILATPNPGFAFNGWSGDVSGADNPMAIAMIGPVSVTANYVEVNEIVPIPDTPSGPSSGSTGMAYNFSTGSGPTNLGHSVEYRFDWGDGTYSEWSSATTVSQSWTSPGDYVVRAQARCATDKHIESGWSDGLPVTIEGIGPDLTGKWVSLTQSCSNTRKGKKCKIKGTSIIENVGNRDALSCKLSFYKSDDDVFGDSDIFLKSVSTGAIKFGKSKSKTLSYSFPLGDSATRKYIIAVIDADENISEIEEVNNFIVSGPVE